MKKIFTGSISIYQFFSRDMKLFSSRCVFSPTCSQYIKEAIDKYGIVKGVRLGARRVFRCHPLQKQYYDPLI
jgi:hypothetical protein